MKRRQPPPDAIYLELFRITCNGQVPTLIIAVLFTQVALIVSRDTGDFGVKLSAFAGIALALARIALMFLYLPKLRIEQGNMAVLKRAEKIFATGSLSFALALGLFGMRAFLVASQSMQLLVTALLLGYAAGMVTRGFAMLRICNTSLCLAAIPIIAAVAFHGNGVYYSLACLITVFWIGGMESIGYIHDHYVERIALQLKFAGMARNDELTGLFNRLALREGFEVVARQRPAGKLLAVHCLDLDMFKPVNDRYGHPVGDQVLREVSKRLGEVLRKDDFAARVGGDEFIVVQIGIDHAWQAERLAERIIEAITAPYLIEGNQIRLGTSVGIALGCSQQEGRKLNLDLDELIARADSALYEVKHHNKGAFLIGGDRCE